MVIPANIQNSILAAIVAGVTGYITGRFNRGNVQIVADGARSVAEVQAEVEREKIRAEHEEREKKRAEEREARYFEKMDAQSERLDKLELELRNERIHYLETLTKSQEAMEESRLAQVSASYANERAEKAEKERDELRNRIEILTKNMKHIDEDHTNPSNVEKNHENTDQNS